MANILIYATNTIGKSMAGPAIRSWELAKTLSHKHHVILIAPNESDIQGEGFTVISKHQPSYTQYFRQANVLITQGLTCLTALQAKRYGIKIIIDAYDPLTLEMLEQFKQQPRKVRYERHLSSINNLIFNFQMADAILCASEKQRDLWIGFLLGQKLISPDRYDEDNSLRNLIDVVPFGLSSSRPTKTGPGLREKFGLHQDDKLILWGGGIWNWFDPLTLIKAIKLLSHKRTDIKLIFMGLKNPDPTVPDMAMATEAIQLAKKLGLIDRTVFFNYGWIPYEERHNYLLDGTIGVSTHFDHLETRYSFRTRMLDYIWTELPILATMGDSFAELIDQHQLGCVVPYQDEKAIAEAILSLVDHPQKIAAIKSNLRKIQSNFYWETIAKPIERMMDRFTQMPVNTLNIKDIRELTRFVTLQVKEKGIGKTLQIVMKKFNR